MKVCLEAQPIVGMKTGIGRYVYNLIKAYNEMPLDLEISAFFLNGQKRFNEYSLFEKNEKLIKKETRFLPGAFSYYVWPIFPFPKIEWLAGEHDLYHCTNVLALPRTRGKILNTVYDVSFLRFPECAEQSNRNRLKKHFQKTMEQSDGIITISEFTKREVLEFFDYPEEKIYPILLGLEFDSSSLEISDSGADVSDPLGFSGQYLLHVGTLEPRKNIQLLVSAFNKLAASEKNIHLVLIGRRGWNCENLLKQIEGSPFRERIHEIGFLKDDDLVRVYRNAAVFVFPSIYEGFGFPPLEAMKCGTPVISSDAGSLLEVLGDSALLFNPDKTTPGNLAELIGSVLHDEIDRERLIQKGLAHARRYTWERTAQETLRVYKKLLLPADSRV